MVRKPNILVHSPAYNTDMNAFGIVTPFALDRGELVLNALSIDYKRKMRGLRPKPLTPSHLRLVHTEAYLASLRNSETWSDIFGLQYYPKRPAATRALPEILDDLRLKSGGTLMAARLALKHRGAANLGAGYHHAYADKGGGFCAINDIAIAIRCLQKSGDIKTALVIDVDFHQGNGTAAIFKDDETVTTVSVFAEEAWPPVKEKSTFDVPIKFNESAEYLPRFKAAVEQAFARFKPDLCIFVQGSDAYEKDAITSGRLMKLSLEQLKERDEFVIDACFERGVPVALCFAGGYGPDTWRVHYHAVKRLVERTWTLS